MNQPRSLFLVAFTVLPGACAPAPRSTADFRETDLRGLSTRQPIAGSALVEPAARINGEDVHWKELAPLLAESSGGIVLRELALDRAVRAQCRSRNLYIDQPAIAAEEEQLLSSIERDTAAPAQESGALLEAVRRSRGLGDARYRSLLERNAMLRALVRDSIAVSGPEIEQAMLIKYGERFRVRAIVLPSERDIAQLKRELELQTDAIDVAFARAAVLRSTDPSAVRAGLLEPISPVDLTYPQSLLGVLPSLIPGRISPIVAVDKGFAIFLLDSKVDATIPPDNAPELVKTEVRLRKERIAMEAEARRLLARTQVTPLAPSMDWSWRISPAP